VNVRQIGIIGGALVVAAGAFMWMRTQAGASQPVAAAATAIAAPSDTQVLVAKKDLMVGERITAESVGWQDWPQSGAANVAFFVQTKTPDAIKSFENGIVRQEMVSGEPVTAKKIVAVGAATSSMAALLTPGMRATSVVITPDSSVAGFVLPNDRVDIVLTRELQVQANGQTRAQTVSATILENVRVLAIDQSVSQVKDQKSISGSTATVELTATDAEKLRLADKLGDISLMLRGYADAGGPTLARVDSPAMAQPLPEAPRGAVSSAARGPETPTPATAIPASSFTPRPPTATQSAEATPTVKVYRGGQ
jgi:pilus assembly protein CpaB